MMSLKEALLEWREKYPSCDARLKIYESDRLLLQMIDDYRYKCSLTEPTWTTLFIVYFYKNELVEARKYHDEIVISIQPKPKKKFDIDSFVRKL